MHAVPDEVMVHAPDSKERGDGGHVWVQFMTISAVREDQNLTLVPHRLLGILAELGQSLSQGSCLARLVVQGKGPVVETCLRFYGFQLVFQEYGARQDDLKVKHPVKFKQSGKCEHSTFGDLPLLNRILDNICAWCLSTINGQNLLEDTYL